MAVNLLHKGQPHNDVRSIIDLHCENHTEHAYMHCAGKHTQCRAVKGFCFIGLKQIGPISIEKVFWRIWSLVKPQGL